MDRGRDMDFDPRWASRSANRCCCCLDLKRGILLIVGFFLVLTLLSFGSLACFLPAFITFSGGYALSRGSSEWASTAALLVSIQTIFWWSAFSWDLYALISHDPDLEKFTTLRIAVHLGIKFAFCCLGTYFVFIFWALKEVLTVEEAARLGQGAPNVYFMRDPNADAEADTELALVHGGLPGTGDAAMGGSAGPSAPPVGGSVTGPNYPSFSEGPVVTEGQAVVVRGGGDANVKAGLGGVDGERGRQDSTQTGTTAIQSHRDGPTTTPSAPPAEEEDSSLHDGATSRTDEESQPLRGAIG